MSEILQLPIRPHPALSPPTRPAPAPTRLSRMLRIWVPVASGATVLAGLLYGTVEQISRQDALALAGLSLGNLEQRERALRVLALGGWLAVLAVAALAALAAVAYMARLETDLLGPGAARLH